MHEFRNRLVGDDFGEISPSASGAQQLSVCIMESDSTDLLRELRNAARALAKECNRLEFTGYARPLLPRAIENAELVSDGNVFLRVCKAWDVMKGKMIIRLDVIGACELPEVTTV